MAVVPLESNPEVITEYFHKLGGSANWEFVDIYGIDEESLSFVPQPVVAVLLLFPITEKYEQRRKEEHEHLLKNPQRVSKNVWYIKQTVENACGTFAFLHAIANNLHNVSLQNGVLKIFLDRCRELTPEERAEEFKNDVAFLEAHNTSASQGQTEAPEAEAEVDLHFICLVEVDGSIYELDGRKAFPINHGLSSTETFLSVPKVFIYNISQTGRSQDCRTFHGSR